jgi:glycosyltransferase involved in cell wall biosynthesis
VQAQRVQAREEVTNARAFGAILANSFYSRESILRAYGLDARVCYLGIDTARFVHQGRPREEFVIGVGALVPEKNVHFAVAALAALPEPRPKLVWVANVAEPGYLAQVQSAARDAGVAFEPRVRIPDTEVVDLLNRAAVMVYAPRLEPFGLAPLEANACGLAVVAVAEGGVRETVVDGLNGLLVPHEPAAMAAAIQRLLRDPAYAQSLGEAGAKWVAEKWSFPAATERLEQALGRVVRESKPSGECHAAR